MRPGIAGTMYFSFHKGPGICPAPREQFYVQIPAQTPLYPWSLRSPWFQMTGALHLSNNYSIDKSQTDNKRFYFLYF